MSIASDCNTEIYQHSLGESEKSERRRKKEQCSQQSSTLENLQAIRFYRFIHQRGISIHYKNRNIVDIELLGVD